MKIRPIIVISFIVFLLKAPLLFAQSTSRQEWIGLTDGLLSNKVTQITQDSSGFIWITTPEGLHRYDGLRFKNYNHLKSSPAPLEFPIPYKPYFNGKNEIWLFSNEGLEVLDAESDRMLHRKSWEQDVELRSVKKIKDRFWLFLQTKDSSFILQQKERFEFDTILTSGGLDKSQNFVVNSNDILYYFANSKKLYQYDLKRKQTTLLDSVSFQKNRWAHALNLFLDSQERIWVNDRWWSRTGPNLCYWDPKDAKVYLPNIPQRWFRTSGRIDEDRFYLTDQKNFYLYMLDLKTEEIKPLRQLENFSKGNILKDRQQTLWVSNDIKGAQRVSQPEGNFFDTYLSNQEKGSTSIIGMRKMAELPNGNILMSSNKGLFHYSKKMDSIFRYQCFDKKGNKKKFAQSYQLQYDPKRKLLWSDNEGLKCHGPIDLASGTLQSKKLGTHTSQPASILSDSDTIWFLSHSHLIPIEKDRLLTDKFKKIKFPHDLSVYRFIRSKNGHLWTATNKGLYEYNSQGILIDRYDTEHPVFPLNHSKVYDIWETEDGVLWLATHAGLHHLNFKTSTMKVYTTNEGLSNSIVCSLLEDDEGYLWMGTFFGLSRFDREQEIFNNFYEEDGLPFYEFNISSSLKTSDGRLYFGSINGAISFDPKQINTRKNDAPLVLTKYATYTEDGEKLVEYEKELSKLKTIRLPHNNKFFRFEFALLDFINPKKNTYSWYLDGFENEWRKPSKLAEAQYNNIPAGEYTFRLRAANYSGAWSDQQVAIRVIIQQAFYKTSWFISFCIIAFLSALYAWYRYRLNQVLKIERMRNKIARDLHDDIGSALTRLSVQSQLIETKVKNTEQVKNFSSVLMQTISRLRDVVWSIDSGHDKVSDLIDRMKDYTYDTLHPKDIAYKFKISGLDANKKLTPAFRQNVYLIFKESINNIVRHSTANEVQVLINYQKEKKKFTLHITDNGQNAERKNNSGLGLKSMQKRAKDLGGTLEIQSKTDGFGVLLECGG